MHVETCEDDLAWYYGSSDAALGVRGQSIDSLGGGVFDEAASHRCHVALRTSEHRSAVLRRGEVEWSLWQLTTEHRATLTAVFAPLPLPWGHARAAVAGKRAFALRGSNVSLVALGVATRAIGDAAQSFAPDAPLTLARRVAYLEHMIELAASALVAEEPRQAAREGVGQAFEEARATYGCAMDAYMERAEVLEAAKHDAEDRRLAELEHAYGLMRRRCA